MTDFTLTSYLSLIEALIKQDFSFQTFMEFITAPSGKVILLRHDVDLLPGNSLEFAKIEAEKGFQGTYYFRIVPESFDEKIIKEIASLGHEIGYHYEDVNLVARRQKAEGRRRKVLVKGSGRMAQGMERRAQSGERKNLVSSKKYVVGSGKFDEFEYERYLAGITIACFKENLEKLRKIVPVKTICMHGSPMSRWDSRLLWKYFDYHDFGIVGEPYFDINFDEVLYLTDTGRRWDGDFYNIRDKAEGGRRKGEGQRDLETKGLRDEENKRVGEEESFHSTFDIIKAADEGRLPDKIMMTFHPQRWTDKPGPWVKELVWQNVKNMGKYFLVKMRD